MRILMVAPTPFFSDRGTHIRILEEALALEKLGHKITISTYHIGKNIDRKISTGIDVRRILRLLFWYKKFEAGPDWQKIILDLMLIRKTFFLARTQKPQIIHAHLHEGVLVGWIVKKILFWRNMKLVSDFHGSLTKEMMSHGYLGFFGLKKIFRFTENIINRMGDWAIVSSWEAEDSIKKSRGDRKVEIVLDGINIDSFDVGKTKEELKKEWEIPEGKMVAGYAGSLIDNKGIGYLLEAIKIAARKKEDIFFLIGGFPPEEIRKFIKENGFEKRVRLISPLDYFILPEFLKICDVGIDPKGTDTNQASGKMLNYMAAGLPVVCFDKINNRNYLEGGGVFCERMDAESLAQGILYFAENSEKAREMGKLNSEKSKEFGWDISARKIQEIYQNLLTDNPK